ncbi:peptidase [Galactobacter valiniphilus]|uniref:Peptidase n=1 Tax=Galactobacter valiniphilus TaxID=2676122 RepID=A0A399JBH9_9MICC|nr:peptidase [Galactobacter valiniphilus]
MPVPARFSLDPTPARPAVARAGSGRRRERRGRTGRGSLLPPMVPAWATRQERFEDLVADSAARLQERWGSRIDAISFDVALVPDEGSLVRAAARDEAPPLGSVLRGGRKQRQRILVFRRPIETVAGSAAAVPWLVHDVVVELVAEAFGLPPEDVDPGYRGSAPDDGH